MPNTEHKLPPASMLVWTVNDRVIEDPEILVSQFHDIRSAGFGGVAAWVRCSRYSWNDAPARRAWARIGELCREHSMAYWVGPDPRFVSHELTERGRHGLEVIVFGDQTRANVFPHFAPVSGGRFSIRCETPPRQVHMLADVAIEFYPLGIVRVYAVPDPKGALDHDNVLDITESSHFFYNARDRYVEAFGRFEPPDSRSWKILAFFRFRTNHVDFSDARQMRAYAEMLDRLREEGLTTDGMIWDEPGFTCTYGTLPYSKTMRKTFEVRFGTPLQDDLWTLALDAADGGHVAVRNRYYRVIQEVLNDAQVEANERASRLWGGSLVAGIHDTWHFEGTDMCDMNHGSLDLWEALPTKSGGFVDLGDVGVLRDPGLWYYANLAALSVIAASLGRHSEHRFAMNNLWTVGDDNGEGWQRTAMDHCVNTMAMFGTRWLAHAYGPVGTIGEEHSFLGSPPLPGYPDHSTWSAFPEWNHRLAEHCASVQDALPFANVLVVYPIETLYALADTRADDAARDIFNMILALVDAHFHVEVLSSSLVSTMEWKDGRLRCDPHAYDAVIYPHPNIVSRTLLPLLERSGQSLLYVFGTPERTEENEVIPPGRGHVAGECSEVVRWLETQDVGHRIGAPSSAWVSLSFVKSDAIVTLAPARHGYSYEGTLRYAGRSITLERQAGLTRVLFPQQGEPRLLEAGRP